MTTTPVAASPLPLVAPKGPLRGPWGDAGGPAEPDPRRLLGSAAAVHALAASARPLIGLATQLRDASVAAPGSMKQALAAAVGRFEREAAQAGCDERTVAAASYLLCTWVDEVVAQTPWGEGGAGLLQRFHGERDGGHKVMRLLSRLAEQPRQYQEMLALFHACLSLGLQGSLRGAPDGARQLETLRQRVHLALQPPEPGLSPPWQSAVAPRRSSLRRMSMAGLLLLALAALGAYTLGQLKLAERVDQVFASMQQVGAGTAAGSQPAASPPIAKAATAVARLQPLLAEDAAAGQLTVSDEAARSLIVLEADRYFARGSTQLLPAALPVLERVAAALAATPGKVLVVGHTDGADPRTARLPSAWHQSHEWALQVADRLRPSLGAERVSAEGAGDFDVDARSDRSQPLRRVEILLYP